MNECEIRQEIKISKVNICFDVINELSNSVSQLESTTNRVLYNSNQSELERCSADKAEPCLMLLVSDLPMILGDIAKRIHEIKHKINNLIE